MSSRIMSICAAALLATVLAGCSSTGKGESTYAGAAPHDYQKLLAESRTAAQAAMIESSRAAKQELALAGIEAAKRCLMTSPENPGCHYWRAVNTGLYHSVHIVGYQKGVKRMISDCKRIVKLDPEYEHAGAYRMLGQIYTQLPQTAGRPDSVTRDLDLAEGYLLKAVQFAPDYPENHLALSETLLAQGKTAVAIEALAQANELTPHWRKDASYAEWRNTALTLEHKLGKRSKQ